jgi:hypothetical protein
MKASGSKSFEHVFSLVCSSGYDGLAVSGCIVGRAFALASLSSQERYDIPRRVSVLGAITSLALGTIVMKSFFFGPSFFSGSRGRGHDGFIGVVVLAAAVDGAYLFWRRTRSASNTNINNPRTTLNHG